MREAFSLDPQLQAMQKLKLSCIRCSLWREKAERKHEMLFIRSFVMSLVCFRDNRRSLQFSELVFTVSGPSEICLRRDLINQLLTRESEKQSNAHFSYHSVSPSSFHPLARSHCAFRDGPSWISATNRIERKRYCKATFVLSVRFVVETSSWGAEW